MSVYPSQGLSLHNNPTVLSRTWGHWPVLFINQRLVPPWYSENSWVQARVLLGPVFKFQKLLEESSSIRSTYCCCSTEGRLAGESMSWRGLLITPRPCCSAPVPSAHLLFLLQGFLVPLREALSSSLNLNLILMVGKIPATLGGKFNLLRLQGWDRVSLLKANYLKKNVCSAH